MTRNIFALILAAFGLFSAGSAHADVWLNVGESIVIDGQRVSCGMNEPPPSQQSATSRTCGQEDYTGHCNYFNETTITGRFCATGSQCGKEDYTGQCIYFNTTAACGDHGCTSSKTCGKTDYTGKCIYFNESATCN